MKAALHALSIALLAGASCAQAGEPQLAWLQSETRSWTGVQRMPERAAERKAQQTEPLAADVQTPIGSVWKLFVYAYLNSAEGQGAQREPVYRCERAQRQPEEEYCCDAGGSIDRDEALAQSCGPYFEPKRLNISTQQWQRFWQTQQAPAWLQRLDAMQPATQVPVADLLQALQRVPAPARVAARQALLPNTLRDDAVIDALGSGPRFKTWSWRDAAGERIGGAAGWLADGTPFWFRGSGTSRTALRTHADWIAAQWTQQRAGTGPTDSAVLSAQACVDLSFFQRYPIESVWRVQGAGAKDAPATDGPMRGRYRIVFRNSTQLPIDAVPALRLISTAEGPTIVARLPLEDYVARVVDREGQGREVAAARALAVAARTYLLQNAQEIEACRQIADDSRTQRVSPNPPSAAARAAAAYTEGVVVHGVPVRYHANKPAPGVLSWQHAVESSRKGVGFRDILLHAYAGGTLGPARAGTDCLPLPQAAEWLLQRQQRWRAVLRAQHGYQPVGNDMRVCQLLMGTPHSDQRRLLIRIREWQTREGRVTLIHEYLHLAFRHHPNGANETFIEQLAQRLADL
jgi:uncharacterized protein YfaQ (DUF2300 family)